MNQYQRLVEFFKSQSMTAQKLGVSQATVSGWIRGKHGMSVTTAIKAERLTDGAFKASQFCSELTELSSSSNVTHQQDKQ